MANQEQLEILYQGVEVWNQWRRENVNIAIDLGEANLSEAELSGSNLSEANLFGANLSGGNLSGGSLRGSDLRAVNLSDANLTETNLMQANLWRANLERAKLLESDLRGAKLWETNLKEANLSGSDLTNADLSFSDFTGASLVRANLGAANLRSTNFNSANLSYAFLNRASLVNTRVDQARVSGCSVYGISVWDLESEFEDQKDLLITPRGKPAITVDNINVAQFIYLILNNEKIRDVINTLTSKSVLILGRFSLPERKSILDALRNKLRKYDLLPIVFDFDRPTDKDFTETIKTLAGLSYFVIADVTNPRSSPLELQATIPDYQIPFVPIIQEGESPFAMMVDLQKKYNWVLNTVSYDSEETLMKVLKPLIIDPAMKKRQELRLIKAQEPEIISAKDFLAKGGL
jgi:Pentapeptide repeats (8 copies)